MDALEAAQAAEVLEIKLGVVADEATVDCFAVPLRPGSMRRGKNRWCFLVVTDLPEAKVREGIGCLEIEFLERRGSRNVLAAWPPAGSTGLPGAPP